jgi:hypothetical protein
LKKKNKGEMSLASVWRPYKRWLHQLFSNHIFKNNSVYLFIGRILSLNWLKNLKELFWFQIIRV